MFKPLALLCIYLPGLITQVVAQPVSSDFSHMMLILDSASFQKVVTDPFIRDSLGQCTYDTMQRSPLVVSYYINGRENFIHFSPNKGYFNTQSGTAYVIFQTRRPGQGALLEQSWKSVTNDSLDMYDYKGQGFTLTEIIYNKHSGLNKKQGSHLVPMLSSYSVESYKKWGFGDSAEVSMQKFIGLDTLRTPRHFKRISSLHFSITKEELADLSSMLKVTGYTRKGNKFIKAGQPIIFYSITKDTNGIKVREMELFLEGYKGSRTLHFGNVWLHLKNDKARFVFQ